MNSFDNDEYELSSDTEVDMILIDLPFDLIKQQIKFQINNPLSTTVNYVEPVIDKFEVLRETYQNNEEAIQNINKLIIEFFSFLITEIDSKFELSVNINDDDIQSYIEIGSALYSFLILRYKKNITRYIYRFIVKNKKTLVEEFEKTYKKKDVTSIAVKKKVKNKDDVLILSNLPSIIKFTLRLEIEPADFISYASKDENYEAVLLHNLIDQGNMIGNFVDNYLSLIRDQYNDVLDEIQTDVKMKLTKKL